MKKLIAMIGAVAMAFGLYAEGTPADNYYSTSFEAADVGVNDTDKTWDGSEDGWTTTQTDAFTLGAQDQTGLPYADGRARRNTLFKGEDTNNNFLKLETGTNTLSHGIAEDQVYFDQLVKFTGYEEDPVIADDAKIAVWMSAIESDTTVEPAIEGATNLYVTVGTGIATKKVKVVGDFKVDQWYRVTIKSIGNVSEEQETSQLGFQLFIDGAAASIVDADKDYNGNYESFNATAAALYDKGQLFTAIKMNDLTLATVAYQGIGGVDDIIFSQEAPDFDQFVEFTVGEVTGVELVKVEGPDGELTVPYAVMPGSQVKIYVKAADGYRIDNLPEGYITKTISQAGAVDISGDLAGKVVKGAVQVVNAATPTVTNVYAEAELGTVLTGLKTGDTATVLENCAIQDKDENTLFSFTANTTVAVPEANVWNVFIAKWVFDNKGTLEDKAGELTDNVGLFAGKTVNVTFDDPVDAKHKCTLYIAGAIAGDITAGAKGLVVVNTDSIETTLTGTLNAVEIDVADEVTFVDSGKIVSATDLNDFADSFLPADKVVITEDAGTYTAQIKKETGFAIIIAGDPAVTNYFDTLEAAIAAAGTEVKGVLLPNVVTILADFEQADEVTIEKDVTIDLNGFTATFTNPNADGIHFVGTTAGVIKNGTVDTTFAAPTHCSLVYFTDASGSVEDLVVEGEYCAWCVSSDTDGDKTAMAMPPTATITCKNVAVTGQRNLFNFEYAKVSLDANCSAVQTGAAPETKANSYAAIALGWKAELTIAGGDYSADAFVISKNSSPVTLTINGGKFTGAFKNWGNQYTEYGEDDIKIVAGNFSDDSIDENYLANTVDAGYERAWVTGDFTDYVKPGAKAIEYTITYMNGDKEITGLSPATYTVEAAAKLPETLDLTGGEFKGWFDNAACTGDAVTEIAAGTTGNKIFYAKIEEVTGEPAKVLTNDVEGDIPAGKEAEALANATALVNAKGDAAGVATWVATVYGEGGKIPAAKLANASAANIALAVEFDVPVMVEPTISAPVVATATEGPAAFEFAIKDGATEVQIKALTENVKKIVKYASALGGTNAFGPAGDNVTFGLNAGKIKAEFVAGPAAGFMKADFTTAE